MSERTDHGHEFHNGRCRVCDCTIGDAETKGVKCRPPTVIDEVLRTGKLPVRGPAPALQVAKTVGCMCHYDGTRPLDPRDAGGHFHDCPYAAVAIEELGQIVRGSDVVATARERGHTRPVKSITLKTPDGKVHDLGPGEMLTVEVEAVGEDWDGTVKPLCNLTYAAPGGARGQLTFVDRPPVDLGHIRFADPTPEQRAATGPVAGLSYPTAADLANPPATPLVFEEIDAVYAHVEGDQIVWNEAPKPNAGEKYAPPVGGFPINPGAPPLEEGKQYLYTPGVYGEYANTDFKPDDIRAAGERAVVADILRANARAANVELKVKLDAPDAVRLVEAAGRRFGATTADAVRRAMAGATDSILSILRLDPGAIAAEPADIPFSPGAKTVWERIARATDTVLDNFRRITVPGKPLDAPVFHGPMPIPRGEAAYAAGRRWRVVVEWDDAYREYDAADPATVVAAAMRDHPTAVHIAAPVSVNRGEACNLMVTVHSFKHARRPEPTPPAGGPTHDHGGEA